MECEINKKIYYCDYLKYVNEGKNLIYCSKTNLLFFTKYYVYDISRFIENDSHGKGVLKKIINEKKDVNRHLNFHRHEVLKNLEKTKIGYLSFCGCKICSNF